MQRYANRIEAGKLLASSLQEYRDRKDVIVLALPRGGVPVAFEVANALKVPFDVFIVRKLGVPWHEELAMGALATGDTIVFNSEIVQELNLSKSDIDRVIQSEKDELKRREAKYRGNRPFPELTNKTVILVDDGIATGATMRAALAALRKFNPANIIVAVPVASFSTLESMAKIADKIICPLIPTYFYAVGQWYEDFTQTTDEEVYALLSSAHKDKGIG